jgi:hypothetical protein
MTTAATPWQPIEALEPAPDSVDSRRVGLLQARAPDGERVAMIAAALTLFAAPLACLAIGGFGLPLVAILGGAAVLAALLPQPVQVGSDGLTLSRGRRSWFISWSEISAIEHTPAATVLRTADGRSLRLVSARQGALDELTLSQIRALIGAHRQSWRPALALRARAAREPLAVWLEAHRWLAFDRAALLRIVESPASPPPLRATAAVWLRWGMQPYERACMMLAASTAAAPGLCAFLVAAAEATPDADLLESLEDLLVAPSWTRRLSAAIERRVRLLAARWQRVCERSELLLQSL